MIPGNFSHWVPFLALASGSPPPNRPMLTRLTEQALVAVASAFIAMYVNDIRHDEGIKMLKQQVAEVREMQKEITHTIESMRRDLYVPKVGK